MRSPDSSGLWRPGLVDSQGYPVRVAYWQMPSPTQDWLPPHSKRASQSHQLPLGQQNCQPQSLQGRQFVPSPLLHSPHRH